MQDNAEKPKPVRKSSRFLIVCVFRCAQVCWDAKVAMGATIQRIQPESKMPEEEEVAKAPSALPEEEEDDVDPFEFLKKIPLCGKSIHGAVDDLVNSA